MVHLLCFRLLLVVAFGPAIRLLAAKAPRSSKLGRRNLSFLRKAINCLFAGFGVGRDILQRKDLALDVTHLEPSGLLDPAKRR